MCIRDRPYTKAAIRRDSEGIKFTGCCQIRHRIFARVALRLDSVGEGCLGAVRTGPSGDSTVNRASDLKARRNTDASSSPQCGY